MRTTARSLIVIILIFTSLALGKSIYQQAAKFKEIQQAEDKARALTKEQEDLKASLEGQKSPLTLEKQARDKLSYQKPGDTLYVVSEQAGVGDATETSNRKNWEVWIDFLFR